MNAITDHNAIQNDQNDKISVLLQQFSVRWLMIPFQNQCPHSDAESSAKKNCHVCAAQDFDQIPENQRCLLIYQCWGWLLGKV